MLSLLTVVHMSFAMPTVVLFDNSAGMCIGAPPCDYFSWDECDSPCQWQGPIPPSPPVYPENEVFASPLPVEEHLLNMTRTLRWPFQ